MSKVWLITGASRGLGRALTEAVLEAGDLVVATARNPEQLVELQGRYSEKVHTVALDVTNEAQANAAFEAAIASFGGLDVLVNNAGYGYVCPVEDTPLADFRAQIETNLFGVIIMTKAVLPYFRERRAGHIIQVTSIAGRIGPAGRAPYAAAKLKASKSRAAKRPTFRGRSPGTERMFDSAEVTIKIKCRFRFSRCSQGTVPLMPNPRLDVSERFNCASP